MPCVCWAARASIGLPVHPPIGLQPPACVPAASPGFRVPFRRWKQAPQSEKEATGWNQVPAPLPVCSTSQAAKAQSSRDSSNQPPSAPAVGGQRERLRGPTWCCLARQDATRTFGAMLGPPHSLGGRLTPLWAAGSTYLLHCLRSPCSHGTEGTPRLLLTAPREQAGAPATSRPVGEGACLLAALPGLGAGHQHFAELARPRASGLLGQSFSAALGGLVSPLFNWNSSPSTEEVASID